MLTVVTFYTLQPENTLLLNAPQIQEEPPADGKSDKQNNMEVFHPFLSYIYSCSGEMTVFCII